MKFKDYFPIFFATPLLVSISGQSSLAFSFTMPISQLSFSSSAPAWCPSTSSTLQGIGTITTTLVAPVVRRKNAELISFESTDSNAVEVDGIRFETVVPNQRLNISENRPDVQTTWQFGVRVTNNTSLPRRVRKHSLIPQFRGLNGEVIFGEEGVQISLIPLTKSDFPLVLPGDSFTIFWEGIFYWSENMLLLGVYQKGQGTSLEFGAFSPGTYHVRLTYDNDDSEVSYYDQERLQIREIREVLKNQFSTPWVEINLVAS